MSDLTLKQIAEMKKAFVESEFGKYAAQEITKIHGGFHEDAEKATTGEQKAACVDRAYGVTQIIRFFTADVALLDQGYFDEKKEEDKPTP
jgi:hypothetical protein